MGDIVNRLRDRSDHYIAQHAMDTMSEAAAEIERLRNRIESLEDQCEAYKRQVQGGSDEILKLQAERDMWKLRAGEHLTKETGK